MVKNKKQTKRQKGGWPEIMSGFTGRTIYLVIRLGAAVEGYDFNVKGCNDQVVWGTVKNHDAMHWISLASVIEVRGFVK